MTKNQRRFRKFIIKSISWVVDIISWTWFKITPRRKIKFKDMNREERRKRLKIIYKKYH